MGFVRISVHEIDFFFTKTARRTNELNNRFLFGNSESIFLTDAADTIKKKIISYQLLLF